MSGICGTLSWAHPTADAHEIEAMLEPMRSRGPDRRNYWLSDLVTMGHALLATTREAAEEILPLTDHETGCTISGDIRLDNRQELLACFDLFDPSVIVGDGELVLRSYLRWGNDCPKYLLGDFAFAIWDPRGNDLFCARDHMGMKPFLYYYEESECFLFSSQLESILASQRIPHELNLAKIADFLENLEFLEPTSTFLLKVKSLPPAHWLKVNRHEMLVSQYWSLKPPQPFEANHQEDYSRAFLQIFTEAVRCRLRTVGPVGIMLSGGLDSGAVAAVAAGIKSEDRAPLHTFSGTDPEAITCVETAMIRRSRSVLEGAVHHEVHPAGQKTKCGLPSFLPVGANPFDVNMTMIGEIYAEAKANGVRVVLDGASADVVLTSGNRVAHLLSKGRYVAAIRETRMQKRFWGPTWSAFRSFVSSFWATAAPKSIRALRSNFRRPDKSLQVISNSFAQRALLKSRLDRRRHYSPRDLLSTPHERSKTISDGSLVVARERYDRIAAAHSVEPRDPFLDIRVLEYCLSLPNEQLSFDGWPKILLRRAVSGLLPDEVRWRRGKEHLGWTFTERLASSQPGWLRELRANKARLASYLSPTTLKRLDKASASVIETETRIRLYALTVWLDRMQGRSDGRCIEE